jgi:glutaredoxin
VRKGEKRFQGTIKPKGPDVQAIAEQHPVTLYSAPSCNACDLVRLQLQNRGVPFAEKDASNDKQIQQQLREVTGNAEGALTVPVVQVDQDVIVNYDNQALQQALDRAGYPPASGATSVSPGSGAPAETGAAGGETNPGSPTNPTTTEERTETSGSAASEAAPSTADETY